MSEALIGVLGGMGPAATLDLLQKILEETPAGCDQDHVPVVTWNVPQIPDRQKALAGTGESPLPAMLKGIEALNTVGATRIAIPCNTAHHWFEALQAASRAPIIHIADAAVDSFLLAGNKPRVVGILATRGTWQARLYQDRLERHGITCMTNTDEEMEQLFTPGCYAIKRGELDKGAALLEHSARQLAARGAERLVLACTEVPLALAHTGSPLVAISTDSNRTLAAACVAYCSVQRAPAASAGA
jgi:aspartate racemase